MKRMRSFLLFIAGTCLITLVAINAVGQTMYAVTDLGTLGGDCSGGSAINESGQIVGWACIETGMLHAFIWDKETGMQDLGTLGGIYSILSSASDINSSGTVVGLSGSYPYHAFLWTKSNGMQDLGSLDRLRSSASSVNDMDEVVGEFTGTSKSTAFLWTPSTGMEDLGTLGGRSSEACAISNREQVVGFSFDATDTTVHAFLWTREAGMQDLGTLMGGKYDISSANAINELQEVVGMSSFSPNYTDHAVLWTESAGMQDLGALLEHETRAQAINNFGEVVGDSGYIVGPSRPFIWNVGLGMQDLNNFIPNASGWQLWDAHGINNAGQITGRGMNSMGVTHAYLLTRIYTAFVQQPINADGSSVFKAKRGVVPVKFTLTQYGASTCTMLPATIAVTRIAGGTFGVIDESNFATKADDGSNFRIDGCQYIYNLSASSLGVGTYRVDISINGIMVGHAVFALQ